jgi:hypothetical protein
MLITESPRAIELHVKRARQSLGRKARQDELKATWSEPPMIERLLNSIAQEDVQVVAVAVDKRAIVRPPAESEDLYRVAVARAVRHGLTRWPQLHLYLDKRYTNSKQRQALEQAVIAALPPGSQQALLIWHEDSRGDLCLQAVDYVAWAIARKYERGDLRAYSQIADKIVVEDVIATPLW